MDKIFGVFVNGLSYRLEELTFEESQEEYPFIITTTTDNRNGNGIVKLNILNKDYSEGIPVSNWSIVSGRIGYDWGSSDLLIILRDADGALTEPIKVTSAKGSASGFNIGKMTGQIFSKAQEIVMKFPSARIYNAFEKFSWSCRGLSRTKLSHFVEEGTVKEAIAKFGGDLNKINEIIENYRTLASLLSNCDSPKCAPLEIEATEKCLNTLKRII